MTAPIIHLATSRERPAVRADEAGSRRYPVEPWTSLNPYYPHRWFAWRPVRTIDGRIAWGRFVETVCITPQRYYMTARFQAWAYWLPGDEAACCEAMQIAHLLPFDMEAAR